MEQDARTCPGCGASSPDPSTCPYCGWTPDRPEEFPIAAAAGSPSQSEKSSPPADATGKVFLDVDGIEPGHADIEAEDVPQTAETPQDLFRGLLQTGQEPVHLLDQVPEELRAVLAGRLKAAEEADSPSFSKNAASRLRGQGYTISQDARGARFAAAPGRSADLSAADVVKMASELDGGVQPRAKLPICSKCLAASPVGETQCQWCGQPYEQEK